MLPHLRPHCLATVLLLSVPLRIVADTIILQNPQWAEAVEARTPVVWNDADASDDAACTIAFAATELQTYLRGMSGRGSDWRIVSSVPETPGNVVTIHRIAETRAAKPLGPEGYRLRTSRHGDSWQADIIAEGRVGVLYACYDLLHRLGVRWLSPGADGEIVPERELRTVPIMDVSERPAFHLRGFHAWENRGTDDFLLWMARNRLNYWCVQQENKPLLHKLGVHLIGGGHRLTVWYLPPNGEYPYRHPDAKPGEARPGDPYAPSLEDKGDVDGNGTITYFEAHPEWYALRGGKRSSRIHGDAGDNFCTSNRDAMTEWVKNAVEDLISGRNAEATLINAWMLDAGKWCECQHCKDQGTPTDRNLAVVHAYAKGIKFARDAGRIHRRIRLLFLAYADVLLPPSKPLPVDFDYEVCIATYFPICRCYVHDFAAPACPKNARYNQHLNGWAVDPKRHYRGQLCIGEYYNVSGYKCLPACFMHTMAADIPYYYSLGARYFHYMHCTTENWGNKSLTNWQMARQVWDPETDCDALWEDYFSARYGPVAGEMRQFYEALEQMLSNVTELKYGLARRLNRGSDPLFPGGHLKYGSRTAPDTAPIPTFCDMRRAAVRARSLITRALAQDLAPPISRRITEDERLFTYGERTLQFYDLAYRAFHEARQGRTDSGRQCLRELMKLADQLRADTTSTAHSSSHASAPNAFSATYATGAIGKLEELLGPVAPDEVRIVPGDGSRLVLTHRELRGGGAEKYTYGFRKYPERTPLSDKGNFIYGKGTGSHDHIRSWFRLEGAPSQPVILTVVGALTPILGEHAISAAITVNGKALFAGDIPFKEGLLIPYHLNVPKDALRVGHNMVEIRNTHPDGRIGNRPWIGIDRIELRLPAPGENLKH